MQLGPLSSACTFHPIPDPLSVLLHPVQSSKQEVPLTLAYTGWRGGVVAYHLDVRVGVVVPQGSQGQQEGSHGWLRVSPATDEQTHLDTPLIGGSP
jgi:hypothetical protein